MEKIKDFVFNNIIFRNVFGVIIGCVIGGMVNGWIVEYGALVIPYPEGYNLSTMESFKSTFHLLQPIHFVVPFLAHAIGTLIGCILVCKLALSQHKNLALIVAALFFLGGLSMVIILYPMSPMWFNAIDLIGAYFPMAWLGYFLANKKPSIN